MYPLLVLECLLIASTAAFKLLYIIVNRVKRVWLVQGIPLGTNAPGYQLNLGQACLDADSRGGSHYYVV